MADRASILKLEDTNDLEINPATEDKQDTIIANQTNWTQVVWLSDASSPIRKNLEWGWDLTVWTSEVEIAFTWTPTKWIRIQADVDNTWIIFIGKTWVLSDKTNDFVRLWAWDDVIIPYNDATNALYAISDTASQTINIWTLL